MHSGEAQLVIILCKLKALRRDQEREVRIVDDGDMTGSTLAEKGLVGILPACHLGRAEVR